MNVIEVLDPALSRETGDINIGQAIGTIDPSVVQLPTPEVKEQGSLAIDLAFAFGTGNMVAVGIDQFTNPAIASGREDSECD